METNTLNRIHQTQKSRHGRKKSPAQEGQKMAQWVKMLREMPDVHLEQTETAPSDIYANIADTFLSGRP